MEGDFTLPQIKQNQQWNVKDQKQQEEEKKSINDSKNVEETVMAMKELLSQRSELESKEDHGDKYSDNLDVQDSPEHSGVSDCHLK